MKWPGCPLCTRVFRRSISTQILAAGDWVLVQYQNLSKYKNNISVVLQRCDASHCIMNTNCVSLAALPTSFSLVFNGPFQSSPPRHPGALLVWHWLSCGFGWNLLPHVDPPPGPAHYNCMFRYSLYISALVFFLSLFLSFNNVSVCVLEYADCLEAPGSTR